MSGSESAADTPAEIPVSPDGNNLVDHIRRRWEAIKAGDAGTLPVIIGLILIVSFFYSQDSSYLTAGNFTNLMVQMAGVTTIAIGVAQTHDAPAVQAPALRAIAVTTDEHHAIGRSGDEDRIVHHL